MRFFVNRGYDLQLAHQRGAVLLLLLLRGRQEVEEAGLLSEREHVERIRSALNPRARGVSEYPARVSVCAPHGERIGGYSLDSDRMRS